VTRSHGGSERRWLYNIKIDIKKISRDDMDIV
jgi:hypothetical protein